MDVARNFASGMCGLSDGSKPGDWRLPNRNELTSLLDMGRRDPALAAPQFFSGFQVGKYWTSTHFSTPRSGSVWIVDFLDGEVTLGFEGNFRFTILVRDGP
jgi:hypothetical protein